MHQYVNRVALKPTQKPVIFESAKAMESIDLNFRKMSSDENSGEIKQPFIDFTLFKQNGKTFQQNFQDSNNIENYDDQQNDYNTSKLQEPQLQQFEDKKIQVNIEQISKRNNQTRENLTQNDVILIQNHLRACQQIMDKYVFQNEQSLQKNDKFNYLDTGSSQDEPNIIKTQNDTSFGQLQEVQINQQKSRQKEMPSHHVLDSKSSYSSSYSQLHGNSNYKNKSPKNPLNNGASKSPNRKTDNLKLNHQNVSDYKSSLIKQQVQSHQRINTDPQHNKMRIQKAKPISVQVPQQNLQYAAQKPKLHYQSNQSVRQTTPKKKCVSSTKKKHLTSNQNFDQDETMKTNQTTSQPKYILLDFTQKSLNEHQLNQKLYSSKENQFKNGYDKSQNQHLQPYIKVDMTLDDLLKNYDQNENY